MEPVIELDFNTFQRKTVGYKRFLVNENKWASCDGDGNVIDNNNTTLGGK